MPSFRIESWAAVAPGLETREDRIEWLQHPAPINEPLHAIDLSSIPAMLRRRFSALGEVAMAVAMPMTDGEAEIPGIFASRHGDTPLALSLLEGIARGEAMSPTAFSLAVHNAISGLFSIVRKDTSETTAIAAMDGLVLQTLFEALGQLKYRDRLFCVIYDIPLPDFYQQRREEPALAFPYAIAMLVSNLQGDRYQLQALPRLEPSSPQAIMFEPMSLLRLLCGLEDRADFVQARACWRLSPVLD